MAGNVGADLAATLRRIQAAAEGPAVRAAATAAGRAGETATKMALSAQSHQAGTPTPSSPGQPPALISGTLRRSIHRTPTVLLGGGVASTTYGPTVIYGIVQEFGMTIHSKGSWPLRNVATGQAFGQVVTLPARPFMRPTVVKLAESGTLAKLTGTAFQARLLV